MPRKQIKFVIGPTIIVAALVWVGYSAFQQLGSYDQTVSELYVMADSRSLEDESIRVTGEVVPGTIDPHSTPGVVSFDITEGGQMLEVNYVSNDPLPDTFRDYSEAVVTGYYDGDGVFTATTLQAKCASRYERELEAGVVTAESTELLSPSPIGE